MTFTCLRQTYINNLKITFEEYRHPATGARHIHLASADDNNVFVVGFLTVPYDSTGVAHILEHTALCGSQRYPVRDPFFMMIRRSLNTFMNAMTGSDWTAYPFASRNVKDFDNLLKVYLDAAFFPNLHVLDFAQEGHRLEFSLTDDPTSPLIYKGVVFNEMKGSLSSPIRLLWQNLSTHLFPTTTYHYNSGGDPLEIPRLTHEQLKAFHATHYHPSNAIFMTYGNLPAKRHQTQFEEHVLQHFQAINVNLKIPDEQRYQQPKQVTTYYPVSQGIVKDKTHIVIAWLLGYSSQIRDVLNLNLLTRLLLSNSASPLYHALETTPFATAPSPLCGFDDNTREATFFCGVEGSNPEHAVAVESLVLQVLEEVANKGIPQSQVEAMLHQIELTQREITGEHYPYGLKLLLNTLSPTIYGGDPLTFLDIDPALEELRKNCENRNFIPSLVRELLLNNPHRLRLVMVPDPQLAEQLVAQEKAQLQALQTKLDEQEKQQIIEQTRALQARQQQQDDPDLLPKVDLSDIPNKLDITEGTIRPVNDKTVHWFACGTNGLVYQTIVIDLPEFTADLVDLLPLFCDCLTEVGCGQKNYQQVAAWKTAVSGGIDAQISWRSHVDNIQQVRSVFSLSGKALARNQAALTELLWEILVRARFDELSRLRELIAQARADNDNSITEQGHSLAMTACVSGISPAGVLSHRWYGFDSFQYLKALDDKLENKNALAELANQFKRIRDKLLAAPKQWVVVSEAEQQENIAAHLAQYDTQKMGVTQPSRFKPYSVEKTVKKVWCTHTDVNFCAKAYPVVPLTHPDAPALMVLGDFLRNGYLHTALREQGGAYGGGANYDGSVGAFKFYSYRDPRLIDTLADFDRALDWLQNTTHTYRALEEGILNVISRIDRPSSPAGEAMRSFFNELHGRTAAHRHEFRKQILQVSLTDLQRVGSTYFQAGRANIAVLSSHKMLQDLPALDLERCEL